MKFTREQYLDLMTFGAAERPMFVELFGLLVGLEEEWRQQGASAEEIDLTAFDWDFVPVVPCGGNTGIRGGFKRQVLEETHEYLIERDELGRTIKLIKATGTLPLPLDFPVKNMDDWQRIKSCYTFHPDRIDWKAVQSAKQQQAQGALVVANIPGGFDTIRELMGDEQACLAYYADPELIHDILATLLETARQVLGRITEVLTIDQLSVHEDLAGKSGPLIGPNQIETFIKAYFRPIWELVSARGTRIFDMDSDGNINPIIDVLLECGLNSMHPFEPAAGMDIVTLRQKYGSRLAMRGGIDKFVLQKDEAAIERELTYKMQPLMQAGGIAFGLDHRIPNGTPLKNYHYYVTRGRELLGLPPLSPHRKGWQRMAF